MRDLAFYEAGCHEVNGIRRVVIPFRRLLRRLLRPIFLHLDSQLKSLEWRETQLDHRQNQFDHRQNQLGRDLMAALDRRQNLVDRDLKAVLAMGWDHVAIARRLAVLEDHLEAILSREAGGDLGPLSEGDARPATHYPGLHAHLDNDEVERGMDVEIKIK